MKPSLNTSAAALSVLLLISGCASHIANPQLSIAASGQVVSEAESAARYRLNPEWWTVYQDAKLNALITQALDNNIDLKQAAINVNKALYQANILGANLVPAYNAGVSADTSRNLKNGESNNSFSSQLGLSYELDLWRKLSATADAQVWTYQASQQDLAASRLSLINNVADAYFNIAYLNEAIRLNQESRKRYQEIHRIAQAKYKQGKVSSAEPTQSEQSLLSAENNLISLQTSRAEAEQTLRNLLNLPPNQAMAADPTAFSLAKPIQPDLNVPISVLANRPDLRAAEARLQSASQSLVAQQRSWYPTITLGASLGATSDKASNLFNIPMLGGSVKVNLPFLNWQTLKWENKTAEANFNSARLSFEQTLTTALNEVATNYQQYRQAEASLANLERKYQLDQKNSRYYQTRYQYGRNELADWLSALNTEYGSAQNLLNQRYQALKYENMVYKAMAGRYRVKTTE